MPPRVLIADDEPQIIRTLARAIRKVGWNVISVGNARDAVAAVKILPPDLLVLDVMMPFGDAFQVLSRLRGDLAVQVPPVILMLARPALDFPWPPSGEWEVYFAPPARAERIVIKPVAPELLLGIAKELLSLPSARPHA